MTESDQRFLKTARIALFEEESVESPPTKRKKMDAGTKFILVLAMALALIVGWVAMSWSLA